MSEGSFFRQCTCFWAPYDEYLPSSTKQLTYLREKKYGSHFLVSTFFTFSNAAIVFFCMVSFRSWFGVHCISAGSVHDALLSAVGLFLFHHDCTAGVGQSGMNLQFFVLHSSFTGPYDFLEKKMTV